MARSGNRDQLDLADGRTLDAMHALVERATDADAGAAIQHHLRDTAERFDMQAQGDGGEGVLEALQRIDQAGCRQHDVHRQPDLGFQTGLQAACLGAQSVDAVQHKPGVGQQRTAASVRIGRRVAARANSPTPSCASRLAIV